MKRKTKLFIRSFKRKKIQAAISNIGSFVALKLGQPTVWIDAKGISRDNWSQSIFLTMCEWRLFKKDEELSNSDSDRETILVPSVKVLMGECFLGLRLVSHDQLHLFFSGDIMMVLFGYREFYGVSEGWIAFIDFLGDVLTYSEDKGFCFAKNEPHDADETIRKLRT